MLFVLPVQNFDAVQNFDDVLLRAPQEPCVHSVLTFVPMLAIVCNLDNLLEEVLPFLADVLGC